MPQAKLYEITVDPEGKQREFFTSHSSADDYWKYLLDEGVEPGGFYTHPDIPAFVKEILAEMQAARQIAHKVISWFIDYEQRNEAGDLLFPPFRDDELEAAAAFLPDYIVEILRERRGEW